jgi:propionate CoA-transferase
LNGITSPGLIERIELAGRPWLFYRAFPVHVGLIRATAADPFGNLVMDEEAVIGEVLPIAQAVHNCGGIVLAQVRRLLDAPAPPASVRVPGVLVNAVTLAAGDEHDQTFAESLNPAYFLPRSAATTIPDVCWGPESDLARYLIACRACDELRPGAIANLGIGMPEGIARIAAARGLLDSVTLTVESGPIGGMPAGGLSFGASVHPQAIIDQPAQFDFYDGGGLDFAALGAAQIDAQGNVNVSRFGNRLAGVGGFVNITQNAKRLVFCSTFTSGDLECTLDSGRLGIVREGRDRKFVRTVEQISFSGSLARSKGQHVLLVTERAVFQLTREGLELLEIAPGIDLERDIPGQMDFAPLIRRPRPMTLPHH